MQPNDFKRKYTFKTSRRNESRNVNIAILIGLIAFILIIYFL